jgi:hypothetical protein
MSPQPEEKHTKTKYVRRTVSLSLEIDRIIRMVLAKLVQLGWTKDVTYSDAVETIAMSAMLFSLQRVKLSREVSQQTKDWLTGKAEITDAKIREYQVYLDKMDELGLQV